MFGCHDYCAIRLFYSFWCYYVSVICVFEFVFVVLLDLFCGRVRILCQQRTASHSPKFAARDLLPRRKSWKERRCACRMKLTRCIVISSLATSFSSACRVFRLALSLYAIIVASVAVVLAASMPELQPCAQLLGSLQSIQVSCKYLCFSSWIYGCDSSCI